MGKTEDSYEKRRSGHAFKGVNRKVRLLRRESCRSLIVVTGMTLRRSAATSFLGFIPWIEVIFKLLSVFLDIWSEDGHTTFDNSLLTVIELFKYIILPVVKENENLAMTSSLIRMLLLSCAGECAVPQHSNASKIKLTTLTQKLSSSKSPRSVSPEAQFGGRCGCGVRTSDVRYLEGVWLQRFPTIRLGRDCSVSEGWLHWSGARGMSSSYRRRSPRIQTPP